MTIETADKRLFLDWFAKNVAFSKREVIWILNYLTNHEAILENVRFVESAEKTPRGIRIMDRSSEGEAITLLLNGRRFTDTDQIFHEIRLHWKEPLYIECLFPDAQRNLYYLPVLEDNPYRPWNENVSDTIIEELTEFFAEEEKKAQLALLYSQIDTALENGDKAQFLELSKQAADIQAALTKLPAN